MYVRLFAKKSLVFRINMVVEINVVVRLNMLVEIWENLISLMHKINVWMDLFCIFYKKKFSDPVTLYTKFSRKNKRGALIKFGLSEKHTKFD